MKRRLYLTCGQTFGTEEAALEYVCSQYTPARERWRQGLERLEKGDYSPLPRNPKLPRSFSLRDKMPPVYDQASRGTCAANAAVALIEYYAGGRFRFSVQYLYERMKRAELEDYRQTALEIMAGRPVSDPEMAELAGRLLGSLAASGGTASATKEELAARLYNMHLQMDGGSTAKYVFSVLEKYGVCTYDVWPYAREQLEELDKVSDANNRYLPPGADEDAKRHRLNDAYYIFPSPNNVEEIKNYLAGAGRYDPMPVYVGVHVFSAPEGAALPEENGFVQLPRARMIELMTIDCEVETVNALKHQYRVLSQDPDSVETVKRIPVLDFRHSGGHAMLLVGYADDDAAPGGGYFLVRNSWGGDWGEGGYGKIPYAYIELFAISAATILRPKGESAAVAPLASIPGDLKAYARVAASDAKDRAGLWRIAKGDLILVDEAGAADRYSDANAAVFRRNGYSWNAHGGGTPEPVDAPPAGLNGDNTLPAAAARFFSSLEIAFQGASIPFPLLGGVKKPGWFVAPVKAESFTLAADLSAKAGAPLRIYAVRGGKKHFRIAAFAPSAQEPPEVSAERARRLVAEYAASQRFDPCDCTITVIAFPEKTDGAVPPYLAGNEVGITLDGYSREIGWRAEIPSHPGDPYWRDWIVRLAPNTAAQWRARFESAYRAAAAFGGHVTLSRLAAETGIPEYETEALLLDFLPGFRVRDGRVEKGG